MTATKRRRRRQGVLTYVEGDLFQSPAQTLVNTVNTVGVMGKGIALQFKRIYPEMFEKYRALCESGELTIGRLHVWRTPNKIILNFPTKEHWRRPSRPEYIKAGLETFVGSYDRAGIHSVAFPPLGCGNGELDFDRTVRPLMEEYLADLPIRVYVYPPLKRQLKPEHRDQETIARWLREEPRFLPFSEVWEDLRTIFAEWKTLKTVTGTGHFQVRYEEVGAEGGLLRLHMLSKKSLVPRDEWQEAWNKLRDGFLTAADFAGSRSGIATYMLRALQELPYVDAVSVGYGPESAPGGTWALHLVPSRELEAQRILVGLG